MAQYVYDTVHHKRYPCVTVLILPEGTNSIMQLSEQLWAEQLRTCYNLVGSTSPCAMALILSEGANSFTLLYKQLWAEQLHTITNILRSPGRDGRHLNE